MRRKIRGQTFATMIFLMDIKMRERNLVEIHRCRTDVHLECVVPGTQMKGKWEGKEKRGIWNTFTKLELEFFFWKKGP